MPMFPCIVLSATLLLLAVYGAGIFPWTLFTAAILLCLALRPWRILHWPPPRGRRLADIPCALLLGYTLLMLLPLPGGLTRLTGETRLRQNREVTATLESVTHAGLEPGPDPVFSISRSRSGTMRFMLLSILTCGGWCIAAGCPPRQRLLLLRGLLMAGACIGIAGMLGKWVYPQGDSLWWFIPIPHGLPGPMGGFMNRNHFAGFCAMLAPAALSLATHDLQHRRLLTALVNLGCSTVLTMSVLLSLSRGGMAALAAGGAALLLIGLRRGNTFSRIALPVAALLLTAGTLMVALRFESVHERIQSLRNPASTASLQTRISAWRDSLAIWRQYPLLGAGPNAYRAVYPQHRTTSARDARDFAENEYVQWLCEAGIAGLLIALLLAGQMARLAFRGLRDAPAATLAFPAASVAALTAAAVHALVDFPLHLPLYTLTLAVLAGMLYPAQPPEKYRHAGRSAASPDGVPHATGLAKAPWFAAAGLFITVGLLPFDIQLDSDGRIGRANLPETASALAAAPTSPLAWRHLAALLWEDNTPSTRVLAEHCLTQAAAYDPNNYLLWKRVGDTRRELGDHRRALDAYQRVKALRDWVDVPTSLPEEH